ncbi:hypothetical protein SUGI_0924970 [Cryptomeria japonica]|nr:hypothetical protein SUGI_0924970 [Cryptomeria japonica]
MSMGNGVEVRKFIIVQILEPERLQQSWPKKNQNIALILQIIGIEAGPISGSFTNYVREEGLIECKDIGIDEHGFELGKNDWGLGLGEEWIPNDYKDVEEIAVGHTHELCKPECPVIAEAMMAQKVHEEASSKSDPTARQSSISFLSYASTDRMGVSE